MSKVAFSLLILLAIALVIILVSIVLYNRRLDKIAKGELRDTHSSVPEPGTTVNVIYKTILMVVLVISLISISTTNGLLANLQSRVNNLQNRQNFISSDIEQLHQAILDQSKLVSSSNVNLDNANFEDYTVKTHYEVVLKEFTDDTTVTLVLDGKEIPLKKQSLGTYGADFTADLFTDQETPMLFITENGKTTSEEADFPQELFWQYLPMPSFEATLESDYKLGKLSYGGTFVIRPDHPENIQSATLTYMTNGRDLKTIDVRKAIMEAERIEVEKDLKLEKDLTMRLEIVTKEGLKIVDQSVMIFATGYDTTNTDFLRIYDPNGNLIWNDKYKY